VGREKLCRSRFHTQIRPQFSQTVLINFGPKSTSAENSGHNFPQKLFHKFDS
jgi:hypothetical protein